MYLSTAALHWLAEQVAGQSFAVSCHTGSPGNSGTANELSTTGSRNYARKTVAASSLTVEANAAEADNTATITLFTPSTDDASGSDITHLGYWRDPGGSNEFFGWIALGSALSIEVARAVTITAGSMDFTTQLGS